MKYVGYDVDDENQIQDIAHHSIDRLNVDEYTVDEFMEEIRQNPFNFMFQPELYDVDNRREIVGQLSLFNENELMQNNEYNKNKYAVIQLTNQYNKTATHKLDMRNLNTLLQMIRSMNFIDDGYEITFEGKDNLYWDEYNLSVY